MKDFQQIAYTVMLAATCLVASPLIIHKIWVSSSDSKPKTVPVSNVEEVNNKEENNDSEDEQSEETTESEQLTTDVSETLFEQRDKSYFDDALFIGDSRTVGIKEYGIFNNSDYFCTVGMSAGLIDDEKIDGLTFDEKIAKKNYGKVYIMLGINEVGNDVETTLKAYKNIIEKVKKNQPDAVIYIQANLHVSASSETGAINNNAIDYLNQKLSTLADNERVFYIDINEIYDDDYGCFNEEYTSDGIHPLGMYYKKWCEWLCTKTVEEPVVLVEPPIETTTQS